MSEPPARPPARELIIMNAEFTPDELSEILLQLDYARQTHLNQAAQYDRWYEATRDQQTLDLRNRARTRADNCQHVFNKTETVLMRKVTEHARSEAERPEDSRYVRPGTDGNTGDPGTGTRQFPEGPGNSVGFH